MKEKIEVEVRHTQHNRSPRVTTVTAIIDGKTYQGVARCSEGDQFNRKTGRKIATLRLNEILWRKGFSREIRKQVFQAVGSPFNQNTKKVRKSDR
jgi:hypothetical protein